MLLVGKVGLMAQRVPFIVAELGADADPFMLHIYAAWRDRAGADFGADPRGPGAERLMEVARTVVQHAWAAAFRWAAVALPGQRQGGAGRECRGDLGGKLGTREALWRRWW